MLLVLCLVLTGMVVGRLNPPEGAADILDWWVINVALVAVVISTMREIEFMVTLVVPFVVAWGILALGAAGVLLLARWFRWSRNVTATLLLCAALGNTSFLGFPAVEALLGQDHLPSAVVFDQFGSFLGLAVYGAFVVSVYSAVGDERPLGGTRSRLGEVFNRRLVIRLATFAPFVALVIGVASRPVPIPQVLSDLLDVVGSTLVPVVMVSIGMRLGAKLTRDLVAPLAVGLSIKMVALPLIVLGVALVLGDGSIPWRTSVLESAMPPMASAGVLAASAGFGRDLAAAMVGVGIAASMVLLPLWSWVIDSAL